MWCLLNHHFICIRANRFKIILSKVQSFSQQWFIFKFNSNQKFRTKIFLNVFSTLVLTLLFISKEKGQQYCLHRPDAKPQDSLTMLNIHNHGTVKKSIFDVFLKNGPTRPLIHLCSSFQTHITIFTTSKYEKMSIQYTVPGFELTTFDLEHESPPLTTKQGSRVCQLFNFVALKLQFNMPIKKIFQIGNNKPTQYVSLDKEFIILKRLEPGKEASVLKIP